MAFVYESVNGNTLTKSQELLLDTIENLPFPFGGISKLKDLRTKTQLKVLVTDRKAMLKDWERYMDRYKVLHGEFFGGKHAQACHRHQGEIGERREFAEEQIRIANEPAEGYQHPPGLYSRTYSWWTGRQCPKVGLIMDSIRDYALDAGINVDAVLGVVFIQEMMHAYFDAFNSKGFPAIKLLEDTFSEFGMLLFVDRSRSSLPKSFSQYACKYVNSKIGKKPAGGGFGFELFELYKRNSGNGVALIERYRDISNWIEPPLRYKLDYMKSMEAYEKDPDDEENTEAVYEYVKGMLNLKCDPPYDPIQPAIGESWDFDK